MPPVVRPQMGAVEPNDGDDRSGHHDPDEFRRAVVDRTGEGERLQIERRGRDRRGLVAARAIEVRRAPTERRARPAEIVADAARDGRKDRVDLVEIAERADRPLETRGALAAVVRARRRNSRGAYFA